MRKLLALGALAIALAFAGTNARAMMIGDTNLVNLLRESDSILIGTVSNVTDGVDDRGLPYTEITLSVEETLKGSESGTYAFRQIGLMNPRPTSDGSAMMLAAPDGMPKYAIGERVLLFLSPQAELTGLRSTVGMGIGRFVLGGGSAENDTNNAGVFQNVSLAGGLATGNDGRILTTTVGAVNPDDLLSLVRRAVAGQWANSCKMWITGEDKNCFAIPTRPNPNQPAPAPQSPNPGTVPPVSQHIQIK